MPEFFRKSLFWVMFVLYNIAGGFAILYIYITRFPKKPWFPKKRIPPAILIDPKYGTHKNAPVNGIRIHYVEAGDKTKPLMIFLHGFPEFWYSWRHQLVEFSKDYWTIAIDLRGTGLSSKPYLKINYKMSLMVEDLYAFIEYLDRKKVILVAHAWGAMIAFEFIYKHGYMVQKYVMMSNPPLSILSKVFYKSFDQFVKAWFIIMFHMPLLPELILMANDFASFNKIFKKNFSEYFTEKDLDAYKYIYTIPGFINGGINYYRTNFETPPFTLFRDALVDGTNGMFIYGHYDEYISKDIIHELEKAYPKLRIEVIASGNHFVQQNSPKEVNKLLRDFLATKCDHEGLSCFEVPEEPKEDLNPKITQSAPAEFYRKIDFGF